MVLVAGSIVCPNGAVSPIGGVVGLLSLLAASHTAEDDLLSTSDASPATGKVERAVLGLAKGNLQVCPYMAMTAS